MNSRATLTLTSLVALLVVSVSGLAGGTFGPVMLNMLVRDVGLSNQQGGFVLAAEVVGFGIGNLLFALGAYQLERRLLACALSSFAEAAVGGQDQRAALVAGVDQLKEQVSAAAQQREVAHLVDDEQDIARVEANPLVELIGAVHLSERIDEVTEGDEQDALAGLDGLEAERHGQVGLAGAGWTQQVH